MNKIYKVIWSKARNCYVVVSELAKRQTKGGSPLAGTLVRGALAGAIALSLTAGVCSPVWAHKTDSSAEDRPSGLPPEFAAYNVAVGAGYNDVTDGNRYKNTQALGIASIAVGYGSIVDSNCVGGISVGTEASTSASYGIALGRMASAAGEQSIAIGSAGDDKVVTVANGAQSIVIGASAKAAGSWSHEDFRYVTGPTSYDVRSSNSSTTGTKNTAIGQASTIAGNNNLALGADSSVTGKTEIVNDPNPSMPNPADWNHYNPHITTYKETVSPASNSTAVGQSSIVYGSNNTALGAGSQISGKTTKSNNNKTTTVEAVEDSTAVGYNTIIYGGSNTAIGANSAIGSNNIIVANGTAIGASSKVTANGGVALGSESSASRSETTQGYDMSTRTYHTGGGVEWAPTRAAVSVGDTSNNITRRITGVAAGRELTDAVNVAQLMTATAGSSTHYFSVNDTGSVRSASNDTNYNNDGARGVGTLAVGENARAGSGANSVAIGKYSTAATWSAYGTEEARHNALIGGDDWHILIEAYAGADKAYTSEGRNIVMEEFNRLQNEENMSFDMARARMDYEVWKKWHTLKTNNPNGYFPSADYDTAVGFGARAENYGQTAIGAWAWAKGNHSTAVGLESLAETPGAIAIGLGASVLDTDWSHEVPDADNSSIKWYLPATNAIAVGTEAVAAARDTTTVGRQSQALMPTSTAYGNNAHANGQVSIAIGNKAIAGLETDIFEITYEKKNGRYVTDNDGKYVYKLESIKDPMAGDSSIAIGNRATAIDRSDVAIGTSSYTNGGHSVVVGEHSRATGLFSTAIGGGQAFYKILDGESNPEVGNPNTEHERQYAVASVNQAAGDYSTAAGYNNKTVGDSSSAFGRSNEVTGVDSIAAGSGNKVGIVSYYDSRYKLYLEKSSETNDYEAIRIKDGKEVLGKDTDGNYIFGRTEAELEADNNIKKINLLSDKYYDASGNLTAEGQAILDDAEVTGLVNLDDQEVKVTGYAVGSKNEIYGNEGSHAGAYGHSNIVKGDDSYAVGNKNDIYEGAVKALAIGNNNKIGVADSESTGEEEDSGKGEQSIAVGNGHIITGDRSGAFGDPDTVEANDSYVFGNNSQILKGNNDSFVIGNNAEAQTPKSVALGTNSIASRGPNTDGGYNVLTGSSSYVDSAHPEYWTSTHGSVSVGKEDGTVTRQITGVAAGTRDTDAVNVAQLKLAGVEIVAGDNVEVIKDTSNGRPVYTIHALNAIVTEGDNVTVTDSTPKTTEESNGVTIVIPEETTSGGETAGSGTTGGEDAGVGTTGGEAAGGETTITPTPTPEGKDPVAPKDNNNHTTTYVVSAKDTITNIEAGDNVTVENISKEGDKNITYRISSEGTKIKNINADYSTVNNTSNKGNLTITDTAGNTYNTTIQDTYTVKAETNPDDHTITFTRNDGGTYKAENIATMDDINNIRGDVYNLDTKIEKVGAGAAALAGLHPLDFDPDEKWDFSAAMGSYKSEQAVAIGAFYRPNEDTMFSIAGTVGNGNNMINVGVSWKFGQKNRISANRISSAKEIIELRKNQENVHSFLADAVAGNQLDLSKIQLFPDVEENHWAYDYVATMAGNGVLEGYPDGYFKGNRNMTRYEMAAVLYRLMQNGARLSDRALTEFAPELDRIRVDTITQHKDGTPHIQRVRTIKERVEEKPDPAHKEEKIAREKTAKEKIKAEKQTAKEKAEQEKAEKKAAKEQAAKK